MTDKTANIELAGSLARSCREAPRNSRPSILVLAPNQWDGPWMNRQQLFSRVGRRYPVVYSTGLPQPGKSNRPTGGWLTGRLQPRDNVLLDRPPKCLVRPGHPLWLRAWVDRLAAWRWRQLMAGVSRSALMAYVFHPKFWPFVEWLRPARLVYHAYDLYHLQGTTPHAFDAQEHALVRSADLVIASSEAIAEHLLTMGANRVELLENASDYEAFASAGLAGGAEPPDLAAVPRPRVGYVGALNRKVDFPLISRLARQHPEWQFVLIGRLGHLDAVCQQAVQDLRACTNVHFLGFKERDVLPQYVAAMDVNVMCYRLGPDLWTAGIYPLKLHEYLAAGRPIVSSDLRAVRQFQDVIRIAVTPEGWETALVEALDGRPAGTAEGRRVRARENNWDSRAARLEHLLDACAAPRVPRGEAGPLRWQTRRGVLSAGELRDSGPMRSSS
jgi:glycosyltransferase involved in cell wall biosynthesis